MDASTVDHVEFYVEDADDAARRLGAAYGLRRLGRGGPDTGLAGQESVLLGQGRVRLLLTAGTAADHPATRHVQRHGPGVGCVALRTADAAASFGAALRGGGTPVAPPRAWVRDGGRVVTAEVGGPAGLTHRFVQRAGPEFLPGGIAPAHSPEPAGADLLVEVDHIALCVGAGELMPTVRAYGRVFGLRPVYQERVVLGGRAMDSTVVQSASGGVTVTIVAPDPTGLPGQLEEFLRGHAGAGVQHLALSTRDIVAAVREMAGRDVRFLASPDEYYDAVTARLGPVSLPVEQLREGNILVDRDHGGELFQIFTEPPFERPTFFFELIQRRGARGFGSNNIRALFAAKEHARQAATLMAGAKE